MTDRVTHLLTGQGTSTTLYQGVTPQLGLLSLRSCYMYACYMLHYGEPSQGSRRAGVKAVARGVIFISPKKVLNNEPSPSEICRDGTNIKLSQTVRNLGVTLDQTLSF